MCVQNVDFVNTKPFSTWPSRQALKVHQLLGSGAHCSFCLIPITVDVISFHASRYVTFMLQAYAFVLYNHRIKTDSWVVELSGVSSCMLLVIFTK